MYTLVEPNKWKPITYVQSLCDRIINVVLLLLSPVPGFTVNNHNYINFLINGQTWGFCSHIEMAMHMNIVHVTLR